MMSDLKILLSKGQSSLNLGNVMFMDRAIKQTTKDFEPTIDGKKIYPKGSNITP